MHRIWSKVHYHHFTDMQTEDAKTINQKSKIMSSGLLFFPNLLSHLPPTTHYPYSLNKINLPKKVYQKFHSLGWKDLQMSCWIRTSCHKAFLFFICVWRAATFPLPYLKKKKATRSHKCFSPWLHTPNSSSYSEPMTSKRVSLLLTMSFKLYLNLGWYSRKWQRELMLSIAQICTSGRFWHIFLSNFPSPAPPYHKTTF